MGNKTRESIDKEDPIRVYYLKGDSTRYTIILIDFHISNNLYSIYLKLVFNRLIKGDLAKLPVSSIKTLIDRDNILVAEAELLKHDELNNIDLTDCLSRPITSQIIYSKLVLEVLRYIDETSPRYYDSKEDKIIDFISREIIKVGDEFIKYKALPF